MRIPEEQQVSIDYASSRYSGLVKELKPVLYREGSSFCCLLGPDTGTGVLGRGTSEEQAIADWEARLRERLRTLDEEDEVGTYICDVLRASNKKVW